MALSRAWPSCSPSSGSSSWGTDCATPSTRDCVDPAALSRARRAARLGRGPARPLPHRRRRGQGGRRGAWSIAPGETLGIVGESGSGKSVSALAVMGLVQQPPAKISGRIVFRGRDLLAADEDELRAIRGKEISMIFQDPLTALNPVFRVGHQVAEVIQAHEKIGQVPARKRAVELLGEVGIPNPRQRAEEYPHQFSGGHAPAGHDRHGPGPRPRAPAGRRAHHGPRRDRPGPDHGPAAQAAGGAGDGHRPHHPRPRGGGRARRPGDGDVRRPKVAESAGADDLYHAPATPTPWACCPAWPGSTAGAPSGCSRSPASRPASSTSRPAARSIPAARSPPRSAGAEDAAPHRRFGPTAGRLPSQDRVAEARRAARGSEPVAPPRSHRTS